MSSLLLLRPKFLALKNAIRSRRLLSGLTVRDTALVILAIFVMTLIYRGTLWALTQINSQPELLYLAPQYPLGMILSLLLFMLLLSSVATAVGSLFLSDDLDLVLASPVGVPLLFFNKLLYILLSTSWMPILFLCPFLVAFGLAYHAPFIFYAAAPLVLFPYFIIPGALAVVVALLLTRFLPPSRSREVMLAVVFIFLGVAFLLADLVRLELSSSSDAQSLSRLVSLLSVADVAWLPSNWAAVNLDSLISNGTFTSAWHVLLLYFAALSAASLAHLTIRLFHFDAYSRAKNTRRSTARSQSRLRRLLPVIFPIHRKPILAIVSKELVSFTRDVTQMVQLVMLLGLCLIYIFNLRVFMALDTLPSGAQDWWRKFFFATNCCMAAFVTTGFCTRFVFVSLSLEGRSFWLLQTGPITVRDVLRAKFACWYVPVAILTSLVFAAAALATGVSSTSIWLSVMISWIVCYGIVGMAIGLGARFVNFSWEHTSQLAVGFGNLVFMLLSISLICLNLVLASLMLFGSPPLSLTGDMRADRTIYAIVIILVIILINNFAKRISISWGERSLLQKLDSGI